MPAYMFTLFPLVVKTQLARTAEEKAACDLLKFIVVLYF